MENRTATQVINDIASDVNVADTAFANIAFAMGDEMGDDFNKAFRDGYTAIRRMRSILAELQYVVEEDYLPSEEELVTAASSRREAGKDDQPT